MKAIGNIVNRNAATGYTAIWMGLKMQEWGLTPPALDLVFFSWPNEVQMSEEYQKINCFLVVFFCPSPETYGVSCSDCLSQFKETHY